MVLSFARLVQKLEFQFLPAAESVAALRQTTSEPKIAATKQRLEPLLRRRAVLQAKAVAKFDCGVLTEPRTTI